MIIIKNLTRVISAVLTCMIIFTACTSKSNSEVSSDSAESKSESSYKYTQELNVIDDNYRTYTEIFLYSYYDSDGDGIGDINGLISKLDYIQDMGFNGIWLMPIMQSPTYHKYDVIDYYTIDKQYGTIDDFKNLIAECDQRGIRVIIDLVINHTSTQNEWFKSAVESLSNESDGQDNKYCNYYNFVNEKPADGSWYSAGNSGWYYEGVFWDQMPDLNLADENLRADIENIVKYWLDLGVAGFRLDAAKEFYSGNPEKNIEVLSWLNSYCKSIKKDCYIVAEVWDGFMTYVKYYQSGIDSVFNFAFAQQTGKITSTLTMKGSKNSAKSFGEAMVYSQDKILEQNPNAIDAPFFTNHDTARAAGYMSYNEAKIKTAAAMNLMMNGNVFVYYGEEIGMSGSGKDENKRAPMLWSSTDTTGITNGPPDMETVTSEFPPVDEQLKDENSILNYYKRAIRIRNENPEIARGILTQINIEDTDICAVKKTYNDSTVYLVYNLSEVDKTLTLDKSNFSCSTIRGYLSADGQEVTLENETLTLPPYSIVVLK